MCVLFFVFDGRRICYDFYDLRGYWVQWIIFNIPMHPNISEQSISYIQLHPE